MWVFIIFILFNIVAFIVPRRIGKIVIYATCLFGYLFGTTTDLILSSHYNLYGYFQERFQWLDLLAVILYFPSISYLFLNFYPAEGNFNKKLIYILLWTVFATTFEWFTTKAGFFYYNGWKLWYSAILYPFIYLILVWNMSIVEKLNQK